MGGGSSPLTRGKLLDIAAQLFESRLIPAHAGKTNSPPMDWPQRRAHPRSRGENDCGSSEGFGEGGSSPLTRGKLRCSSGRLCSAGLIPAHAGKTCGPPRRGRPLRAHPRSRGENSFLASGQPSSPGSSPLTRGKLLQASERRPGGRLIPAHAGKTCRALTIRSTGGAHPRSRGENATSWSVVTFRNGSSPLTRGKPGSVDLNISPPGLIPAHAGKTRGRGGLGPYRPAHPRSRGENVRCHSMYCVRLGSSPLTRGKLELGFSAPQVFRLIPAHAGKTPSKTRRSTPAAAHPRSRGENAGLAQTDLVEDGSSPLTRGKLRQLVRREVLGRLIPAHAGKTLPDLRFYCADRSDLGNP